MKVLIAGGTSFVGRAIAWSLFDAGHEVTVVNRGSTPNDLPDRIERLVGDRQGDLSILQGRRFDATVDAIAYRPSDVERLAAALGSRGGHHVQISSISAYAEPSHAGGTESTMSLHDESGLDLEGPITGSTYGPLKAAAERAARRLFDEPVTIVRPTYVVGAHDATLRFPYWVERARRGGDVVVPGPSTNAMQWIDARDLANFVTHIVTTTLAGSFHATGPSPSDSYTAMVRDIVDVVAPHETKVREVDAQRVIELGLEGKFPLWSGPDGGHMLELDNSWAFANGMTLRPLEESVRDVVQWWGDREWPSHWLTADEEATLVPT